MLPSVIAVLQRVARATPVPGVSSESIGREIVAYFSDLCQRTYVTSLAATGDLIHVPLLTFYYLRTTALQDRCPPCRLMTCALLCATVRACVARDYTIPFHQHLTHNAVTREHC